MIKLHELKVFKGSRKRRKVVGRGLGSGHGTYSTRGAKGQNARKSGGVRPGFEGGRQPLIRQVPKLRGFKSIYGKNIAVRVSRLNKFNDGDNVDLTALRKLGIISNTQEAKIVDGGAVKKKLHIKLPISAKAKAAVEKAGGTVA